MNLMPIDEEHLLKAIYIHDIFINIPEKLNKNIVIFSFIESGFNNLVIGEIDYRDLVCKIECQEKVRDLMKYHLEATLKASKWTATTKNAYFNKNYIILLPFIYLEYGN